MGGCTITRTADNLAELLADMENQIISASKMGLWVDSELVVIDPTQKEALICKVVYAPLGTSLTFVIVDKGRAFHVGVAARYGEKPKHGQIVGTVHVHS